MPYSLKLKSSDNWVSGKFLDKGEKKTFDPRVAKIKGKGYKKK